ncbi:CAP domain-containing protein [Salinibacterium sp. NYA9b]
MGRVPFLTALVTVVIVGVVPFVGGGGPGLTDSATASAAARSPLFASTATAPLEESVDVVAIASIERVTEESLAAAIKAEAKSLTTDSEHLAQKAVPKPKPIVVASTGTASVEQIRAAYASAGQSCPGNVGGGVSGAPSRSSSQGVAGTTSGDLASFAYAYNSIRVANCLQPIALSNFRYDSCMEERLFWMAESPSSNPLDGWGHNGTTRSDGVAARGCDGNLAGGSGNSGATVASKWWESYSHRASLYRPGVSTGGACIAFAMTHGGIDEPYSFTRAAARWTYC